MISTYTFGEEDTSKVYECVRKGEEGIKKLAIFERTYFMNDDKQDSKKLLKGLLRRISFKLKILGRVVHIPVVIDLYREKRQAKS